MTDRRESALRIWIVALALLVCVRPAIAAETEQSRPARSESLEIPGLTAGCHVCEWRPKLNQRPAAEQCGNDKTGNPRLGLFECGYSEDCQRLCNFLSCAER